MGQEQQECPRVLVCGSKICSPKHEGEWALHLVVVYCALQHLTLMELLPLEAGQVVYSCGALCKLSVDL